MILGVPRESHPGETRIAVVPGVLSAYAKRGVDVLVETGAGAGSGYADEEFAQNGARIASTRDEVFSTADLVAQVRACGASTTAADDLSRYRKGQAVFAFAEPLAEPAAIAALAERGVTLYAAELVPRITRAQSMDALSSMATIAGYKASLLAANTLPKIFPLLMTAAGTLAAANVLILGAGVAGLQAIATCRRLGAVVRAYDVRSAVKEQVESLGAKFLELEIGPGDAEDKGGYAKELGEEFYRKQREMMLGAVGDSDVVITTAAIPGRKAPVLVTEEMVRAMRAGSVIVDLAAERGGNCELTVAGETVVRHDVTIAGPENLPATVPVHASQMYARNVLNFVSLVVKEGAYAPDFEDEVVSGTAACHDGSVAHPRVKDALGPAADRA